MTSKTSEQLHAFYEAMLARYDRQHWWPGETPLEVMVGAVLTQNTNWHNVEKAIENLRAADCMSVAALAQLEVEELAALIRPAGYYNTKARRLKNLITWLQENGDGTVEGLADWSVPRLREELLGVKGVGRETADSIILYALDKPTFVVDTYTHRILTRHGLIDRESDYEEIKDLFERHLDEDAALYNEYHALIVRVGKEHCRPKARCEDCPLAVFEHDLEPLDG